MGVAPQKAGAKTLEDQKMKHLRTLALVLCSILLLLTAASCNSTSGGKPKDLYEGTFAEHDPVLNKAEKVTLGTPHMVGYGFVMTKNDTTIKVYDMMAEKEILQSSLPKETTTVDLKTFEIGKARCFALCFQTDNTYKTSLYQADGKLLKEAESEIKQPLPENILDLLVFEDMIYRANGETLSEVSSVSALANHVSKFEKKMGDRYYDFGSDSFSVYDSNGAFYDIYVYEKAEKTQYYLLENGNVLIQQQRPLPDDASKYDYSEDSEKLQLKTYLWQAEKKAAKEISFDYLIGSIYPVTQKDRDEAKEESGITFNKKVTNFALLTPIKDNMLQTQVWVLMDNSGSVTRNLSEQYKGLSGIPYPVADGVFAYETRGGQTFYINGEGKLLHDMSTVDIVCGQYLTAGNKLYDANCNLLFDYGKEGYELKRVYETCAIFSKGTDYIRFNGTDRSNMSEIRSTDSAIFEDEYYTVTASNGETSYYAPDGTLVYKSKTWMNTIHGYNGKILFSDIENGETVYVLFTLK